MYGRCNCCARLISFLVGVRLQWPVKPPCFFLFAASLSAMLLICQVILGRTFHAMALSLLAGNPECWGLPRNCKLTVAACSLAEKSGTSASFQKGQQGWPAPSAAQHIFAAGTAPQASREAMPPPPARVQQHQTAKNAQEQADMRERLRQFQAIKNRKCGPNTSSNIAMQRFCSCVDICD